MVWIVKIKLSKEFHLVSHNIQETSFQLYPCLKDSTIFGLKIKQKIEPGHFGFLEQTYNSRKLYIPPDQSTIYRKFTFRVLV